LLSHPAPGPLASALAAKRRDGAPGGATAASVASGRGWRVLDVVCTSGPDDPAFEEQHDGVSLSLVTEGGFVYRSGLGRAAMTPGAMLLGDAGACFRCGHEHGEGDRCLSFQFDREIVARASSDLGARFRGFRAPRTVLAPRVVSLCKRVLDAPAEAREERAFAVLAAVLPTALEALRPTQAAAPRDERRALELARHLDEAFRERVTLADLASHAGLSRFHLLRLFRQATGVTPHQYVLRRRIDWAAHRLLETSAPVTTVAYDCGFEDLSNFNRTFRGTYGLSPRAFRRARGAPL